MFESLLQGRAGAIFVLSVGGSFVPAVYANALLYKFLMLFSFLAPPRLEDKSLAGVP
jgi:hypothetical protein